VSDFTVTPVQVFDQVAEGSVTSLNGECLIWIDSNMRVITEKGVSTAQQAIWYLDTGEWVPTYPTCGTPDCLRVDHLTDSPAQAAAAKDEEVLALVQRTSVSLASLYRKAKGRGLLSGSSGY
jgi:hypothetical protein